MGYYVVRLSQELFIHTKDYCLEYPFLHEYLTDSLKALADTEKGHEITYLIFSEDVDKIVAYFTVKCSLIHTTNSDGSTNRHPSIEITKFAVDLRFRGQGHGKYALQYIFKFVTELTVIMPVDAIVVMAVPASIGFYEKFQFAQLPTPNAALYTDIFWRDCVTMYYALTDNLTKSLSQSLMSYEVSHQSKTYMAQMP